MFFNSDRPHRGKSGTGEKLAGFLFLPIGLLFIFIAAIPTTYSSLDVYRWTAVPAEVISVELNESWDSESSTTKQSVAAQIQYQWNGINFTSKKLHILGVGNLSSDWSRHTFNKLKAAMDKGSPVTTWVNPSEPHRAVIDRTFVWGQILLVWFVPLIFCLLGYLGLRHVFQSRSAPNGDEPWLASPKWRDNLIHSGARSGVTFWWIAALVLGVIGILPFTATSTTGSGVTAREVQLITVFPLNLLVLAAFGAAFKSTWQWWRYGASPLILDPFPGAIGGDVGGEILLRVPYQPNIKAEVQLTAVRKEERSEDFETIVEWQEDGYASVTEKNGGVALQFRFAVPEGLPESDISYERRRFDKRHYEWTLSVTITTPGEVIKRSYEIPVYPTGERAAAVATDSLQENPFASSHHAIHQILPVVRHQGAETILKFPMRGITTVTLLMLWLGLGLTLAGGVIVFMGSGINMTRLSSVICLAMGLMLIGRTLYRQFNALRVQFTGNIVASERLLLGIPLRSRFVSYYDIKEVAFKLAPRTKRTESSPAEHIVYAVTDKGEITLAERIEGRRKAELVCEHLRQLTAPDGRRSIA